MATDTTVDVDGFQLRLSNLDKVLYPETGFTKGELVDWYARLAPVLVPHLGGRPLTLKRYPNGVEGEHVFEKACPSHRPPWLPVVDVPSRRQGTITSCTVEKPADLVWLANLADIELHPLLSRAPALDRPDQLVFDLDPGPPAGWAEVTEVALVLRGAFERLGLDCVVKSSGSEGLHVAVPLEPVHPFDATKAFARDVAELLARQLPDLVVTTMRKERRTGRVLVDWSRNDRHRSTVAPWSVRARVRPWIAVPLRWDEVAEARSSGDWSAFLEEPDLAAERLDRWGDLAAALVGSEQRLPGVEVGTPHAGEPPLRRYQAMRDFAATPEPAGAASTDAAPAGDEPSPRPGGDDGDERPCFVVHEHDATRLHWDLRLEHGGVLLSWAVPRGLPWSPDEDHLAVHTEDHPIEYLDFHGEIPEGQYGAGRMTVWDRGRYVLEKLEERKVRIVLDGERVHGRYALFTLRGRDWMIHRMDPPEDPSRQPIPHDLLPMRAETGGLPPDDGSWCHEIRWRGLRVVATSSGGTLGLRDAAGEDVGERFPEVRRLPRALGSTEAVLDGVAVGLDEDGAPEASRDAVDERLAARGDRAFRRLAERHPVALVLVDVLWVDGHPVVDEPYERRRERLESLGLEGPAWTTPDVHAGDASALLEATATRGLAGVVAKRRGSPYRPGERSPDWIEVQAPLSRRSP